MREHETVMMTGWFQRPDGDQFQLAPFAKASVWRVGGEWRWRVHVSSWRIPVGLRNGTGYSVKSAALEAATRALAKASLEAQAWVDKHGVEVTV